MTTEVSQIGAATQIVSCGTPLPGLTVKIVDSERHAALETDVSVRFGSQEAVSVLVTGIIRSSTLKQFHARLVDDSPL